MSSWIRPAGAWLAEVYLLSTVVLTVTGLIMLMLRQPARRLVVARSALVSLVLLVPITAVARGTRSVPQRESKPRITSTARWTGGCCPEPSALHVSTITTPAPNRPSNSLTAIFVAFAGGSGAMVAWLGLGAIASGRLARSASGVPDKVIQILNRVVDDGARAPRLVVSATVCHPVAVGLIRPSIVLPTRFAKSEPVSRIEAALAHEWAHIRNGDLWTLALSRLLLPLLFAHPLYAWLRRAIRADQELLADAEAAAREGRIAYAEALLSWSRTGGRAASMLAPSLGLWGRSSMLTKRITLLLNGKFCVEPTCPKPWSLCVRAVSTALTLCAAVVLLSSSARLDLVSASTPQELSTGVPHTHHSLNLSCPNTSQGLSQAELNALWAELGVNHGLERSAQEDCRCER